MATRRKSLDSDQQLDLFSISRKTYDTAYSVRPNGRETLARIPAEHGSRPGEEGAASEDAFGSGRKDERRNGESAHRVDDTGPDRGSSTPTSLGDRAREIHPSPA